MQEAGSRDGRIGLTGLAGRMRAAADTLAGSGKTLARADPGAAALCGAAPGPLGELCAGLCRDLRQALAARAAEATAHAALLGGTADRLCRAAAGYEAADERTAAAANQVSTAGAG